MSKENGNENDLNNNQDDQSNGNNEDNIGTGSERANERIRQLVADNKGLKSQNETLTNKISELEDLIKNKNDNKDVDDDNNNNDEGQNNNNSTTLENKVNELEFTFMKDKIIELGILPEEALEKLSSIKEIEIAVDLAKTIQANLEKDIDEKATKKAKIIIEQTKSDLEGEREGKDQKIKEFKSKLKQNGLL